MIVCVDRIKELGFTGLSALEGALLSIRTSNLLHLNSITYLILQKQGVG